VSISPRGFYQPPPSDRELTEDIVWEVLRDQFPELALRTVKLLGSGWEHDAYLVDDHLVVRFPRYADVALGFEREEGIRALVASVAGASFGVPRITLWGKPTARFPHRFAGHELIPGVAIDDPRVPVVPELADDIGHSLSLIHSIPAAAANAVDVDIVEDDPRDLSTGLHLVQNWVSLVPEITRAAPDACAWLRAAPVVPRRYAGVPRFIHNDFQNEHIIVNPVTGRLSGIIDWSGAILGDPARDFSYVLLARGWAFVERAMNAYDLPLDAEFAERVVFSARLGSLAWLADAIKRRADTTALLETVRRAFAAATPNDGSMGYDIHITRATDWADRAPDREIGADEWLAYISSDPSLTLDPTNGHHFAVWSGESSHGEAWFDWSDGQIYTKNPDPPVIAKAVAIAYTLGGRVQGDDGETYLPDGQLERDGQIEEDHDWRTW